jgi:hypothetical protein
VSSLRDGGNRGITPVPGEWKLTVIMRVHCRKFIWIISRKC